MKTKFEECSNCRKLDWCASSQFISPLCGKAECNPFLVLQSQKLRDVGENE